MLFWFPAVTPLPACRATEETAGLLVRAEQVWNELAWHSKVQVSNEDRVELKRFINESTRIGSVKALPNYSWIVAGIVATELLSCCYSAAYWSIFINPLTAKLVEVGRGMNDRAFAMFQNMSLTFAWFAFKYSELEKASNNLLQKNQ